MHACWLMPVARLGAYGLAVGRMWAVASSVVGPGSQALLVARGVARVR